MILASATPAPRLGGGRIQLASAQETPPFYDFSAWIAGLPDYPVIGRAEEGRVFAAAFGKNWARHDKPYTITARITGAFTRSGAREIVYIARDGDGGPGDTGKGGVLVVFDGTRIVATEALPLASYILRAIDLDHDDRIELLIAELNSGQGYTSAAAKLVTWQERNLKILKAWGDLTSDNTDDAVYQDDCNASGERGFRGAVIDTISTAAGLPDFNVKWRQGPCPSYEE